MIETYYSNSYEFLRELMGSIVAQGRSARRGPHGGPFARDHILVPSAAVADDLNMYFARKLGVATGLWFDYIGRWLERFTERAGAAQGTFLDDLDWMILALLEDKAFLEREACARLRHYASGQGPAALCDFAARLSRLFVTYTTYRLDWVIEWMGNDPKDFGITKSAARIREKRVLEHAPDAAWQREMWYEIKHRLWGTERRPWFGSRYLEGVPGEWRALLSRPKPAPEEMDALHIFVPSGLPPLALAFLQALSRTTTVRIYCLNPSSAYWFETLPKSVFENWKETGASALDYLRRNAASERAQIERIWNFSRDPDTGEGVSLYEDDVADNLNEEAAPGLLKGVPAESDPQQPVLDLANLHDLRAQAAAGSSQTMIYVNRPEDTVLGALQQAIVEDDAAKLPRAVPEDDHSITFVKAPGAAREVEGLLDWIQSVCAREKARGRPLAAHDILVVTPDINAMAPVISAVLDNRPADQKLAYSIVGQSVKDVNSAAQAILAVGRFLSGRAERRDFEALLQYPIMTAGRGASGIDCELASTWLAAAGYRFGLTQEHAELLRRKGAAQPEGVDQNTYEGTLQRALERLALGSFSQSRTLAAMGDVYGVRGDELGGFQKVGETDNAPLLDYLFGLWEALSKLLPGDEPRSALGWQAYTHGLIDTLFPEAAADDDVFAFRRVLDAMVEVMHRVRGEEGVAFEVFWTMLSVRLEGSETPVRATGRIVFAPIGAFRWLPRRVIAVLGLNEGPQFPGVNRSEEFDLMQAQYVDPDAPEGPALTTRRRGDRDSRANNRNVFFDLLISARDYFYCSYTAGTDAVEKNPSVVLSDLMQTLAIGLGGEEIVQKALVVRLAAQAASPESFAPGMGLLASHDAQAALAVNEAEAAQYLAAQPPFMNASALAEDEQNASRTVSFKELQDCLLDPERWLLRAAGIGRVTIEGEPDVALDSLFDNALLRKIASTRILDEMQAHALEASQGAVFPASGMEAGKTGAEDFDEELVDVFSKMPAMGLEAAREPRAREGVSSLRRAFEKAAGFLADKGGARVKKAVFDDFVREEGLFRRLKFSAQTLCETPEGDWVVFFAISSRDAARAMLRYLALSAVAPNIGMLIVTVAADPGASVLPPVCNSPHAGFAKKALVRLMELFERVALSDTPVLATADDFARESSFSNGAPIWLGNENRALLSRRAKNLLSAIAALEGAFAEKAPEPASGAEGASAKKKRSSAKSKASAKGARDLIADFEAAVDALGEMHAEI